MSMPTRGHRRVEHVRAPRGRGRCGSCARSSRRRGRPAARSPSTTTPVTRPAGIVTALDGHAVLDRDAGQGRDPRAHDVLEQRPRLRRAADGPSRRAPGRRRPGSTHAPVPSTRTAPCDLELVLDAREPVAQQVEPGRQEHVQVPALRHAAARRDRRRAGAPARARRPTRRGRPAPGPRAARPCCRRPRRPDPPAARCPWSTCISRLDVDTTRLELGGGLMGA